MLEGLGCGGAGVIDLMIGWGHKGWRNCACLAHTLIISEQHPNDITHCTSQAVQWQCLAPAFTTYIPSYFKHINFCCAGSLVLPSGAAAQVGGMLDACSQSCMACEGL